jgi:hypothetical protein
MSKKNKPRGLAKDHPDTETCSTKARLQKRLEGEAGLPTAIGKADVRGSLRRIEDETLFGQSARANVPFYEGRGLNDCDCAAGVKLLRGIGECLSVLCP